MSDIKVFSTTQKIVVDPASSAVSIVYAGPAGPATTDASLLTSGTLNNARLPAAATTITSVGTLGSLAVSGGVTASTFTGALVGNASTVTTNANLTGDVTSVGNATTLTNASVIAKVLTGYVSGAGTVSATDSLMQAIQKLNGNITALPRGLMATPATSTTSDTFITTEETMLSYTFTFVGGRSYLITYFEPTIFGSASATMTARIKESATTLNTSTVTLLTALTSHISCQVIYVPATSGASTFTATLQTSTGTGQATRSATRFALLYALDIGIV
jgi:hypothetical protein